MRENPLNDIEPRALGARLRDAREARSWTQQQVAAQLGMARTTVVSLEKGERRLRPEELIGLASILGRSVSELLQRSAPEEGFAAQLRGSSRSPDAADVDLSSPIEKFQHLCEDYVRLEELCQAPLRRRYPSEYEIQGVEPGARRGGRCRRRTEPPCLGRGTTCEPARDPRGGRRTPGLSARASIESRGDVRLHRTLGRLHGRKRPPSGGTAASEPRP